MIEDHTLIWCVHPITEDLRFLRRLIKPLKMRYPGKFRQLKLLNDLSSHKSCLNLLSQTGDSLVIFLCHGYSGCILGCDFSTTTFDAAERLTERFDYGPFIDASNVSVLTDKRVIAFCCYSNGIAESAVKAGAKAAIGFDSIRFDYKENCEKGISFKKLRAAVKFELRVFLYQSFTYAINNNLSFFQLVQHMRLLLNKRHREVLVSKIKHRKEVAAILLEMKDGIKMFGDRKATIVVNLKAASEEQT